jgi:Uma2 family endonuclease
MSSAPAFRALGPWSEEAYLDLTDATNRPVELPDGRLGFLPIRTELHQALVGFLYHALLTFVNSRDLGVVPFPPLRVRVRPRKIREPDVLFLRKQNFHLRTNRFWNGADLVMDVVSPDAKDRQRDYQQKLAEYAEAGIAEYWIIDADKRAVTVHRLDDRKYSVHGQFAPGAQAGSVLLPGFTIDVTALFAAIDTLPK